MPRKLRFNPQINRIKLNPEQTVLACNCYGLGHTGKNDGGSLFAACSSEVARSWLTMGRIPDPMISLS